MNSTAVDRLRRFVNRATDHNTCELCRSGLPDQHRHLLESVSKRMLCACDACALLFSDANGGRFRPIPRAVTRIDLQLSDDQWNGLGIPIGMAFFTVREPGESKPAKSTVDLAGDLIDAPVMVGYPSPAGPVMSSVEQDDWQALLDSNPEVMRMRPEVESLLINRTSSRRQAFVVPLDLCFELIGIVRRHWNGFSGGSEVHREIDRFFDQLEGKARKGMPS